MLKSANQRPIPFAPSANSTKLVLAALLGCSIAAVCVRSFNPLERRNVSEEMQQVTKSLDDLLSELAIIKREATGRLSSVKSRPVPGVADPERILQTKVSKFVLKRVQELETESQLMREELSKMFELKTGEQPSAYPIAGRQEDHDFDEATTQQGMPSSSGPSTTSGQTETTTSSANLTTESSKLGFDVEALKRLGEEISKRLDQFGRDAAKNLADLVEGVKLVFREPPGGTQAPKVGQLHHH